MESEEFLRSVVFWKLCAVSILKEGSRCSETTPHYHGLSRKREWTPEKPNESQIYSTNKKILTWTEVVCGPSRCGRCRAIHFSPVLKDAQSASRTRLSSAAPDCHRSCTGLLVCSGALTSAQTKATLEQPTPRSANDIKHQQQTLNPTLNPKPRHANMYKGHNTKSNQQQQKRQRQRACMLDLAATNPQRSHQKKTSTQGGKRLRSRRRRGHLSQRGHRVDKKKPQWTRCA